MVLGTAEIGFSEMAESAVPAAVVVVVKEQPVAVWSASEKLVVEAWPVVLLERLAGPEEAVVAEPVPMLVVEKPEWGVEKKAVSQGVLAEQQLHMMPAVEADLGN